MVKKRDLKLGNLKINKKNINTVKINGKDINKENERKNEAKLRRLKMYRTKVDYKKMNKKINEVRRIEPNIKWFNNSRTISQNKLELFRNKLEESCNDPFSIIVKRSKFPVQFLKEEDNVTRKYKNEHFLACENFEDVFGKKKKRKKPKLNLSTLEEFINTANENKSVYDIDKDKQLIQNKITEKKFSKDILLNVGTSKRIWNELYKVVDSSDVILEILDSRDPMGTRCIQFEQNLKKDRPHKHLILVLNKIDLIPISITEKWIKILSKEYPTIAYHADINNPFGKKELFQIIRQYVSIFKSRKHVHIGLIGYPNVGKSAIINSLKKKKVCISASLPGQTKYWQIVKLTNKIYLIDCPGIVPYNIEDNDKVLRCTMRVEKITNPEYYIQDILNLVNKSHLIKLYKLSENVQYNNSDEFLEILANKMGKLLKGGEPDIFSVAKIVLNDWLKGKLPYFISPQSYLKEKENKNENKDINQNENINVNKNINENKDINQNENINVNENKNENINLLKK